MSTEPGFCGFCRQPILTGESMQIWTENGRLHGLIIVLNGKEVRHVCRR